MNKWLDNVYRYSVWIITALAIIGYFAYRTLSFEGSVQSVIESWDTWTNLAFIIFLNLTVQTGAPYAWESLRDLKRIIRIVR